jgi:hypothetical protein
VDLAGNELPRPMMRFIELYRFDNQRFMVVFVQRQRSRQGPRLAR